MLDSSIRTLLEAEDEKNYVMTLILATGLTEGGHNKADLLRLNDYIRFPVSQPHDCGTNPPVRLWLPDANGPSAAHMTKVRLEHPTLKPVRSGNFRRSIPP